MRNKKGLTLIEVMIAFSILLFVVIMAIGFFPAGLKSAYSSRQETTGLYLAQAKIEEIISLPYAELSAGQTIEASLSAIDPDFAQFARTTTLTYVDADLEDSADDLGLLKVEVSVSWTESQSGETASTSLITLVTQL